MRRKTLETPFENTADARRRKVVVATARHDLTRGVSRASTLSAARGSVRPRRRRPRASASPLRARRRARSRASRASSRVARSALRGASSSPPPRLPDTAPMRAAGRWTRAPPEAFSAASLRPALADADEARTHREAGNALFVREQWRDAVARYDASVALDASNASTFTNRAAARCALAKEHTDAKKTRSELVLALRDAERSVEIDKDWVKGHYRKGFCLQRLGAFAEARDAFRAGLERDPRNAQIETALKDAELAIKETPENWEDAKTRGNACYRDGKYEDAAAWYTRGLEFLLMTRRESGGNEEEDEEDDDELELKLEPADPAAETALATLFANRAEARRQMGECRSCVADCDRALRVDPHHVKAIVRRALAHEYLEQFERSARDFEAARRLDPANEIAREGWRRVAAFVAAFAGAPEA